jgi:nicotinate-nucleotide adenylyltransferase
LRPPERTSRQVLFGGTFDPIHLGHLDLIRHVLAALSPDIVWVCPARRNPLKSDATAASEKDRAAMTRLAVQAIGDSRVRFLGFEAESEGPSYTLLTVRHLKEKGAGEVTLVMGNEVFSTLPRWYQPLELLSEANVFVVSREPMTRAALEETMKAVGIADLKPSADRWTHGKGMWIMPRTISALPFSATAIRAAIRRYGERPEGLADSVWGYIKQRALYTDN